jgi:hypothetical protein
MQKNLYKDAWIEQERRKQTNDRYRKVTVP